MSREQPAEIPGRETARRQRRFLPGREWAVLGLVTYGYLVWAVDPRLQLFAQEPPLSLSLDSLASQGSKPGGIVGLLSAGLLQVYANAYLGAAVTVANLGLITGIVGWILTRIGPPPVTAARWLPVICLVALQSRYELPIIRLQVGLAAALLGVRICGYLAGQSHGIRIAGYLGLTALAFYAGGGVAVYTAGGCALLEWAQSRPWRWKRLAGWGIGGAALPGMFWGFTATDAAHREEIWRQAVGFPPMSLTVLVPATFLVAAALAVVFSSRSAGESGRLPSRTPSKRQSRRRRFWAEPEWAWPRGLLLAGLALVTALATWDGAGRTYWWVSFHARHGRWAEVLRHGSRIDRIPLSPARIAAYVDTCHALYQRGRLPEDQFAFPQIKGIPLIPKLAEFDRAGLAFCDLFLELGQINYAQHWAYECLEIQGARPGILQRLALIHEVKGEIAAARIHLNVLSRHPRWRSYARRRLERLAASVPGPADPRVIDLRGVMVRTDLPSFFLDTEPMLRQALEANPRNRLAFEYLMAHHLLLLELDKFVDNLRQLDRFNYPAIPRHYEEALLLFRQARTNQPLTALPAPLRQGAPDRFQAFLTRYAPYRSDVAAARRMLEAEYGDTYWYYAFCAEPAPASEQTRTEP